jgi:hypothetical protein
MRVAVQDHEVRHPLSEPIGDDERAGAGSPQGGLMQATTELVSTWPGKDLLPSLRSTLAAGDEGLLCVAFVNRKGVALLAEELSQLVERGHCRLLLTSVFGGGDSGVTAPAAQGLLEIGVDLRVLNWTGGTYHPKMFLTRRRGSSQGLIGSGNLTSGLLSNVETGIHLRGPVGWEPLRDAWRVAEQLWEHPQTKAWSGACQTGPEPMTESLLSMLLEHVGPGSEVRTIAGGKPNLIVEISAEGVWVETESSRRKGVGPQRVDPWMLDLAWAELTSAGEVSNDWLLNKRRVHRSSFVCAALAHMPGVHVESRKPIRLVYTG